MRTLRDYIERISAPWLLGRWARRLVGACAGLMGDAVLEASSLALLSSLLRRPEVPEDALRSHGYGRLLECYPSETSEQYRARMLQAWAAWEFAGTEQAIVDQLAAAGRPGALVYDTFDWPDRPPTPWWSQFWLLYEAGQHAVPPAHTWDEPGLTWGADAVWSSGLTRDQVALFRQVVRKWRAAHVVMRGIYFETSATWDTGQEWDGLGLTWDDGRAEIEP